jgi:hypothetical protein
MSDYTVISDVSDTLTKLLWEHMRQDPAIYPAIVDSEEDIILAAPRDEEPGKFSLFLYEIIENPYLKNQEVQSQGPDVLESIPLPLDLFYLATPKTEDRKKDHVLMGKAMQVFHDNAVLKGSILQGSLAGGGEVLRIVLHHVPFDKMFQLWQGFSEKEFKLSVCYRVTPVKIDSTRETEISRIIS